MLTKEEIIKILRKELPYFRSNFGVEKIGLFGSFAKGIPTIESDVDIIVEFKKPIGLRFVDFAEHIENILGRKIDILTPEGLNSIRIKKVQEGIKRNIIYV